MVTAPALERQDPVTRRASVSPLPDVVTRPPATSAQFVTTSGGGDGGELIRWRDLSPQGDVVTRAPPGGGRYVTTGRQARTPPRGAALSQARQLAKPSPRRGDA